MEIQSYLGPLFGAQTRAKIIVGAQAHDSFIVLMGCNRLNFGEKGVYISVTRGSKLLCPHEGYAIASYEEHRLRDSNDLPHSLNQLQVRAINRLNDDIVCPGNDEEQKYSLYSGGYVVQLWHPGNQCYTRLYGLDWVDPAIPYYSPDTVPGGDLVSSAIMQLTPEEYSKSAVLLHQGAVLGESGSLSSWGDFHFDQVDISGSERPDFRGVKYPRYLQPSVRMQTLVREPSGELQAFDPFGINDWWYLYPSLTHWHEPAGSLWMPQG